jgi:hypothetical protein
MKRLFVFALCVFPLLVFLQLEADSVGALTKDYLNSDPNWNHIKDAGFSHLWLLVAIGWQLFVFLKMLACS